MAARTEVVSPMRLLLSVLCIPCLFANPITTSTTAVTFVDTSNSSIAAHVLTSSNSNTSISSSTVETTSEERPMSKCEWTYKEERRNSLFAIGSYVLSFHVMKFHVKPGKRRCYMTRNDLESKLDAKIENPIIGAFGIGCLERGTEIVFLENEEVGQLSRSPSTTDDAEKGLAQNGSRSVQYRFHSHYIQYMQIQDCRIQPKAVWMVANMTDLRVFTTVGETVLDLAELEENDVYCEGFQNLVSFSILNDWTLQDKLHYLSRCQGFMDNVVEMDFYNSSLTSFPGVLQTVIPNLCSLDIKNNNLTSPVEFPWKPGFTELPRNLSRTYQFNSHYNYAGAFDMEPNLFRKVFSLDGNRITNLTDFQFTGEFQYISMERNGLREISENVFSHVSGLQFLSLAHNNLDTLPEHLFVSVSGLKRLDLQGNSMTRLPNDTFKSLLNLETLDISDNRLEVLQEGLFTSLRQLKTLKLKNNNLVLVSDNAFSTLSVKLAFLDLKGNPLKEVPPIVFLLRGLENINLEQTSIEVLDFVEIDRRTSFPILVEGLKNPTTGEVFDFNKTPDTQKALSLRNSGLRSIVVFNATEETRTTFLLIIKYFTIFTDGSKLTCDCNILNVTHMLQNLVDEEKLSGTEAFLSGWKCIWPLELSGRPVVRVSDHETYCPLEEDAQNVTSCPERCQCFVRTGVNTVIVDCQNTGLTSLPETVPADATELWLQNNTIKTLEMRPYLSHVRTLNLTSNNIQRVPMHVLKSMREVRRLDVKDNWLTSLAPGFAELTQLQHVRLSGNPFRCDCHTRWMKEWLLRNQGLVSDWAYIKCSTDGAVGSEGQVITAVPDQEFVCKVSASLGELAVPIAVPVALFLPILVISVIAFLLRRRLKVLLYVHTGLHPFDRDPPDHGKLYDVTLCCDVTEQAWVLRNVVEPLENDYKYKVFFYCRDSFVGFTISENVRHCVKNSRRLVAVLGKSWQSQDLLVTATRQALDKCRKDMVHFMTILLHEISAKDIQDKDIQQYAKRGRSIVTDEKHFIKKLVYEMPHVKADLSQDSVSLGDTEVNVSKPIPMHDILAAAEKETMAMIEREEDFVDEGFCRQISGDSGIMDNPDVLKRQDTLPQDDTDKGELILGRNMLYHRQGSYQQQVSQNKDAKLVFVWYANVDLAFTLKTIVEPLEKAGHACILKDRDFPLGAAFQDNIVHAAERCTRCVLVLSDYAARDEWFTFIFHLTFDRQLQSREHRVGLVKRENTAMENFVETIQQTVASSALLEEDGPWFWKRLLQFVEFDDREIC